MLAVPYFRAASFAALFLAAAMIMAADPSEDLFDLSRLRVKITERLPYVETRHGSEKVLVMRHQDPGHRIEPPYEKTSRNCPPFCIQPMVLAQGVETIGELELIEYLERVGEGEKEVLVIDSRSPEWLARGMIPGAVSIPYTRLDRGRADPKEIARLLELDFGAVHFDGLWSFGSAKTLIFYCNGPWCGQSATSIRALLDLGYPPGKLKWFRGGMQAWEQMGLTTVRSEE